MRVGKGTQALWLPGTLLHHSACVQEGPEAAQTGSVLLLAALLWVRAVSSRAAISCCQVQKTQGGDLGALLMLNN